MSKAKRAVNKASRSPAPPTSDYGFLEALGQIIAVSALETLGRWRRSPRGCPIKKLSVAALLQALLFHFLFCTGTLVEHVRQLLGISLAASTLSERRTALGLKPLLECLRLALRPLARPEQQPEAFWRGWRLVAWDGTQFSLTNTPQILARMLKAATRRGRAAWAKIRVVVLLEVGLHNPLAAQVGCQGESEVALARRLVSSLTQGMLLLADRLSGGGILLGELYTRSQAVGAHFLVRVVQRTKVQVIKTLRDGSRLVTVTIWNPEHPHQVLATLTLRQIRVTVSRPGWRSTELRLWTTLLDPKNAPAAELTRLYAKRWEQELYWRQMKLELRKSELLTSHTLETGTQEILLLVLATALLAQERLRAAAGQRPVLEISFVKCLELLRPLWLVLALAGQVLEPTVRQQLARVVRREIQRCVKPKRRARSCVRAVRQPVTGWPRLIKPKYATGPWSYAIVKSDR